MKIQFIYVWRLDKEKGIEHLIYATEKLIKNNMVFALHIYGKGQYDEEVQQLASEHPNHVHYYGWMKKNDIIPYWKTMDFFIMPSQFLETFGLTACESLLCWVPVIGNKKWWLIPFIDNTLNLQSAPGSTDGEKLVHIMKSLITHTTTKDHFSSLIKQTQTSYSKTTRYGQIQALLPEKEPVLYISDYINYNGGGIETHIHDSIKFLWQQDHDTKLYWHQAPTWKFVLLKKLAVMAISIFNIPDTIKIKKKIKKWKTWLIRRHSISRVIGWLPVACSDHNNQIISHHELGLFHPYPSKTHELDHIPKAWSLSSFIQAWNSKNPIIVASIIGKFCLVRLIHKQLKKKVKTHIVPSERMIDMVKQRHPYANVVCIPHFVDIE